MSLDCVQDHLSHAVGAVEATVELLATHGPETCNVGLRAIADVGRQGLDGSVDPMIAAAEMQRRWRALARPISDVVVHSDDNAEQVRLNTELEMLIARLRHGLREATGKQVPSINADVNSGIVWAFAHRKKQPGGPGVTPEWVHQRFGAALGDAIMKAISRLQADAIAIGDEIDWEAVDLASAQRQIEQQLADANPGLDRSAAHWIARWFSFQVK